MKSKGLISFLAISITLISIYQLYFSYAYKSKADEIAVEVEELIEEQKDLSDAQMDSLRSRLLEQKQNEIMDEEVAAFGATFRDLIRKKLNLGLDLQGGISATLVVSQEDIIRELAGNKANNPKVAQAIEEALVAQNSSSEKFVDLFYEKYQAAGGGELKDIFYNSNTQNIINRSMSDQDILEVIYKALDDAIDRSVLILAERLDKYGTTQPIIHAVKTTGRIEVELPGVQNRSRVRKQLSQIAKLEFREVIAPQEGVPVVQELNKTLAALDASGDTTGGVAGQSLISIGQGGSLFVATKDKKKIAQYVASSEVINSMPVDMSLVFGKQRELKGEDEEEQDPVVPAYLIRKGTATEALLEGDVVDDANATFDELGNPAVSMSMNIKGAEKWRQISEEYSQNGKQVAVILDNIVYSAPVFRGVIPNGQSEITGDFGLEEAKDLANVLKAGHLPARLIPERIGSVGPTLGQEAVNKGLLSLGSGLALVVLFMIAYYSKGGLIANIALLFNIFFILGILSTPSIGATLTLAGMAGIVLTIGMSIDANVLIFERIREELKAGISVKGAIDKGYQKAFMTILDANVTTLITAAILYSMGSGPIKGFAVTLIIGIFCSFFAAVFITRLIVEYLAGRNKEETLSFTTGLSKNLFQNVSADFIGKRKIAYVISSVVIITGITLISINGLNLGVAFKGGRNFIVQFDSQQEASEVKAQLSSVFAEGGVAVKTYDRNDQLSITTGYLINDNSEAADSTVQAVLLEGLVANNADNPRIDRFNKVGPTIVDEIISQSIWAIVFALLAVFGYILVRFSRWQFGLGALAALFHDVLVVLSCFAIADAVGIKFEVDEAFIAAILTIVGYSINDTVVVFDRVREQMNKTITKTGFGSILNTALNGTLSRTLMTSVTTLIVVLVLLIFGGEALRGFSFAMLIGVIVGTYSSVFVATPIVLDTSNDKSLEYKEEEEDLVTATV